MLVLTPSILESVFKSEENKVVHEGVRCDGCGMDPIRGIRYTCTVRPDFDLCEACEALDASSFPMTKLRVPEEEHKAESEISNEPVQQPVVEPVVEPIVEPVVEPIVEPIVQPVVEPIVQPVVEPIVQPVVEPIVQPVVEPIVQPVVEPIVQPVIQQPAQRPQPVERLRKYNNEIETIFQMGFVQDPDFLEVLLQTEGGNVQRVMDVLLRG
jgi:hypothetical protein